MWVIRSLRSIEEWKNYQCSVADNQPINSVSSTVEWSSDPYYIARKTRTAKIEMMQLNSGVTVNHILCEERNMSKKSVHVVFIRERTFYFRGKFVYEAWPWMSRCANSTTRFNQLFDFLNPGKTNQYAMPIYHEMMKRWRLVGKCLVPRQWPYLDHEHKTRRSRWLMYSRQFLHTTD